MRSAGSRDTATPAHYFVRLLQQKGVLHKMFTQNADMLENKAGIDDKYMVYAHGHLNSAACSVCKAVDSAAEVNRALDAGTVRYCFKCKLQGK